ncbi:hypothetical protein HDU88_003193 [Geranomyces variabilis]|nr:hypothetical protein HDU88_003193 [Geranomyces variabilis]
MGSGSEAQLRAYQLEMRQNGNHIYLLHHAAQHGQVDVLARLLDAGADINRDGNNREKALHTAVQFGHLEVVQFLLARGADPNATADWPFPASPKIMTPMHYAVLFHSCTQAGVQLSLQMVNVLLDAGANPHSPPGVFRFACKEGRYDVATCILDRGGFPAPYPAGDRSALLFSLSHAVTTTGGMDSELTALMVSKLLDLDPTLILTVNDYEPEDEMKGQYTPLIEDPYEILGRANWAGRRRLTPLLAVAMGKPPLVDIMDLLLDLGADPNQAVSETGATVLHLLATPPPDEAPDAEAVQLLLAGGADASLQDTMGRTAADVAIHSAIKTQLQTQQEVPVRGMGPVIFSPGSSLDAIFAKLFELAPSVPVETQQGLLKLLAALKSSMDEAGDAAPHRMEVEDDSLYALDYCLRNLDDERVFPALELLRLVVTDHEGRSRWICHPQLSSPIAVMNKYGGGCQDSADTLPQIVRLLTLRLACNLFTTRSSGAYLVLATSNRRITTALAAFDASTWRRGIVPDESYDDWLCELVAAVSTALQREDDEMTSTCLLVALGCLLRGASDTVLMLATGIELREILDVKIRATEATNSGMRTLIPS